MRRMYSESQIKKMIDENVDLTDYAKLENLPHLYEYAITCPDEEYSVRFFHTRNFNIPRIISLDDPYNQKDVAEFFRYVLEDQYQLQHPQHSELWVDMRYPLANNYYAKISSSGSTTYTITFYTDQDVAFNSVTATYDNDEEYDITCSDYVYISKRLIF